VSKSTIIKWQRHEDVEDRSHRAHTLHTTLSAAQELIVVELRRLLELSLNDLLVATQRFINPDVSRSGLNRLLQLEGLESLRAARAKEEKDAIAHKKDFKTYAPGFIHIDIKYLPRMPDETSRRTLFVAIDRASRWGFLHIYDNQSEASSLDFLKRLQAACPIHIRTILTDNGTPFTGRFTSRAKQPSGKHVFDQACVSAHIEHRLIPPRHPQTNGRVERFNGRISELCQQTHFASAAQLEQTLKDYLLVYNHFIPQQAIGHQSPVDALASWYLQHPELFVRQVYKQTECDTVARIDDCCRKRSIAPIGLIEPFAKPQIVGI
jgi:transposase InsO family protein